MTSPGVLALTAIKTRIVLPAIAFNSGNDRQGVQRMPVWRVELYESRDRKVPKKVGHIRATNEVVVSDVVVAKMQDSELKHADMILTILPDGSALPVGEIVWQQSN